MEGVWRVYGGSREGLWRVWGGWREGEAIDLALFVDLLHRLVARVVEVQVVDLNLFATLASRTTCLLYL